ncbi:hypothetical protein STEG23_034779 [Scotinomys teguina]
MERAFEGGAGRGEWDRDWLRDLDFDFISPFPFSLGDRDRDLLRDFPYSSLDLLLECEWEPRSDLGLHLLFDLDFRDFSSLPANAQNLKSPFLHSLVEALGGVSTAPTDERAREKWGTS